MKDDLSEDTTHYPSKNYTKSDSDSDSSADSTPRFTSLKALWVAVSHQLKSILLSLSRDKWAESAKLILELLRITTMRLKDACKMFKDSLFYEKEGR